MAGSGSNSGSSNDGIAATSASVSPLGVYVDGSGNILIAEFYSKIRYVTSLPTSQPIYGLSPPKRVLNTIISNNSNSNSYSYSYRNSTYNICKNIDVSGAKGCFIWSGYTIAEAWAEKRQYFLSRGRLDVHRAGNEILREIFAGKVVFALAPPA